VGKRFNMGYKTYQMYIGGKKVQHGIQNLPNVNRWEKGSTWDIKLTKCK